MQSIKLETAERALRLQLHMERLKGAQRATTLRWGLELLEGAWAAEKMQLRAAIEAVEGSRHHVRRPSDPTAQDPRRPPDIVLPYSGHIVAHAVVSPVALGLEQSHGNHL